MALQLRIVAIGRLKDEGERALVDRYVARFKGGKGGGIGPLEIVEMAEARQATANQRQRDEAARLVAAVAEDDVVIALDERGKSLSSHAFSDWLGTVRDDGARRAVFLIGGADGHGPEVRVRARLMLALGAMTLPHGLARVVLAEQLYRASTILAGHPYHRN